MTERDDQMTPEQHKDIEEHADRLIAETHQSASGMRTARPLGQPTGGEVELPGAAAGDMNERLGQQPADTGHAGANDITIDAQPESETDITMQTGALADNAGLEEARSKATDRTEDRFPS
jgi:hypothetical protein